jgi:hypothetical protein
MERRKKRPKNTSLKIDAERANRFVDVGLEYVTRARFRKRQGFNSPRLQ